MVRKHVIVRGDVHGVGFRWGTRAEAERLGVGGWVRNQRDGSVETEIDGEFDAVQRMLDWLQHGPEWAHVTEVEVTEVEVAEQCVTDLDVTELSKPGTAHASGTKGFQIE